MVRGRVKVRVRVRVGVKARAWVSDRVCYHDRLSSDPHLCHAVVPEAARHGEAGPDAEAALAQ